jgi:tRNA (cmo5U34)-methyltransferase
MSMSPQLRGDQDALALAKSVTGGWTFGNGIAERFEGHIRQSVPMYDEGHAVVQRLSRFFCKPGGTFYELGVATGKLLDELATHTADLDGVSWVGIDNEPEMVAYASNACAKHKNVQVILGDITRVGLKPTNFIVSYYTLQFLPLGQREDVLRKAYEALSPGGAFVLFEKIRTATAQVQEIANLLYWEFKKHQGLSAPEILDKAYSLIGVMDPATSAENVAMCRRVGFTQVEPVVRYVCFEGLLAIK